MHGGDDYEPIGQVVGNAPLPPPPPLSPAAQSPMQSPAPSPNSPARRRRGKPLKLGARRRWKKEEKSEESPKSNNKTEDSTIMFEVESEEASVAESKPRLTKSAKFALVIAIFVLILSLCGIGYSVFGLIQYYSVKK